GLLGLRLALHVAALDLGAHPHLAVGAELEGLVVGEVLVPVLDQEVVIRQEDVLPAQDGLVVFLRQGGGLHAHPMVSPYKLFTKGRSVDGSNPRALKKRRMSPCFSSSTSVRTLWAPRWRKCSRMASAS